MSQDAAKDRLVKEVAAQWCLRHEDVAAVEITDAAGRPYCIMAGEDECPNNQGDPADHAATPGFVPYGERFPNFGTCPECCCQTVPLFIEDTP